MPSLVVKMKLSSRDIHAIVGRKNGTSQPGHSIVQDFIHIIKTIA